jgi:hypothetical protein
MIRKRKFCYMIAIMAGDRELAGRPGPSQLRVIRDRVVHPRYATDLPVG